MRCKICEADAVVHLPQHNLALCEKHFIARHRKVVLDTIRKFKMFTLDDRVAVAVSGGKDSLGLLHILKSENFDVFGVFIDLGLGEFQERVNQAVQRFSDEFHVDIVRYSLKEHHGVDLPEIAKRRRKQSPCSFCGTIKRYLMNKIALENGARVLATGHNLNDETAFLLANALRWDSEYLSRQSIVLQSTHPKLLKKVKPLAFLTEKETAAYAFLTGIDFVRESCPFSKGARLFALKRTMTQLEARSPGTKLRFYREFLSFKRDHLPEPGSVQLNGCEICGYPTTARVCAFCRITQSL